MRPGVPMTISAPVSRKRCTSCAGEDCDDETKRNAGAWRCSTSSIGCDDRKALKTVCICVANSRVGLITKAPISFFRNLVLLRTSFSKIGITKARVLPEPVTASTTTSLCFIKRGMVEACTGVICACPIDSITSRLQVLFRPPSDQGSTSHTYIHGVKDSGSVVQEPAKALDMEVSVMYF